MRTMRDKWCPGQWQAFVTNGKDLDEQKARLEMCPKNMQQQVREHMRTYYKIKRAAEHKKRRLEDERKK